MKVSKLIEILKAQDQDANVSIYTGWEGQDYMSVKGINHYPDGYSGVAGNTILLHSHNNPPSEGRRPARKVVSSVAKEA